MLLLIFIPEYLMPKITSTGQHTGPESLVRDSQLNIFHFKGNGHYFIQMVLYAWSRFQFTSRKVYQLVNSSIKLSGFKSCYEFSQFSSQVLSCTQQIGSSNNISFLLLLRCISVSPITQSYNSSSSHTLMLMTQFLWRQMLLNRKQQVTFKLQSIKFTSGRQIGKFSSTALNQFMSIWRWASKTAT